MDYISDALSPVGPLWVHFGISVCIETMRQWFIRLGYSLIFPRYLLLEANEREVEEAAKEIEVLLEKAKLGEIVLIFMDEATFKMVPTLTRIWAKKGSKPMVPTYDDKRQVVIGGDYRWNQSSNREDTLSAVHQCIQGGSFGISQADKALLS